MAETELKIIIDAENRVSGAMKEVGTQIDGLQAKVKSLQPVFKSMAVTGGIALAGIVAFGKGAVDASATASLEMAKFGATMATMGEKGKAATQQLLDMAKASIRLGFDDEASANSLAKMYQRTGDVTQAIKLNALAMDLARAKSVDLETATNLVNLALSGSGRALLQYGIVIKDSATPLEALGILQEKVGGQAEAAAKTYKVQMEALSVQVTNVKEAIGDALIPILQKFVERIVPIVEKIMEWTKAHSKLTAAIIIIAGSLAALVTVIGVVGMAMGALIPIAGALGITLGALLGWIIIIPIAIAALIAVGILLYKHWDDIKAKAIEVWGTISTFLTQVWENIKSVFKIAIDFIVGLVVLYFKSMGIDIVAVMGSIKNGITIAWDFIKNVWKVATDWIKNLTSGWGDSIKGVIQDVVNFIADKFKWITDKFDAIKNAAGGILDKVSGSISGAFNKVVNVGKSVTGFAMGGIVPGPTGAPMMAMVHGGERVLTAEEAENVGGQTLIFNFNDAVAGDEGIKQIILRTISQLNRGSTLRGVAGQ